MSTETQVLTSDSVPMPARPLTPDQIAQLPINPQMEQMWSTVQTNLQQTQTI